MKKFQVDHFYLANDTGFGVITVEKRTSKMIFVANQNGVRWRMRIRVDENGNEYAVDSSVPRKWQYEVTYQAIHEG